MRNIDRLYLINVNLKNLTDEINNFNVFDDVRFAESIYALARQVQIMRNILDDMRLESEGKE